VTVRPPPAESPANAIVDGSVPPSSSARYALRVSSIRCETRLYNAFNDELRAAHGLVTSQFEFLRYLRDRSGSRVADLAAEFAVGVGAVSKSIDRMEKRGWVTDGPTRTTAAPRYWC
jgi:hypothetical protein